MGVPVWHASQAAQTDYGPIPIAELGRKERRLLRALGEKLLEGRGEGPLIHHEKQVAVHVRRKLTRAELDGLDPEWLSIPAVDMG